MVLFVIAVCYDLCTTFRTILVVVRLVHIQPVYAQLLKGHNVVLSGAVLELFELGFKAALGALQRLNGEPLRPLAFQLPQSFLYLKDLLRQKPLLPLHGDGYLLKLRVADDNGVVFAGGDAGAELLAVLRLEVLFRSHEDVGGGVQPQELARPLLRQVVGNDKEGFVAQPQPLGFHGSGYHLEG